ncbi:hypothetical protein RclHR1_11150008 [Rhizophagus clarus]|uniref:MARVEL domain-containing protein n=1 Tax=Rhizophagus clarus TaxID=94130 RepID=A0A2Z6Q3F8_9GLOM|nr:hypothetical protein RclHR1_11150008 [Rhizophagus clarus]
MLCHLHYQVTEYPIFTRLIQCVGSLIVIIVEILRHTGTINLIESEKDTTNDYELFFEYCVMNLGFVLSALYLFRFNQRWEHGPYKVDIFIDCILMNAWMIFGILRLSPEFDNDNVLSCNKYEVERRGGCIVYISTLILGYFISGSYFSTAILSTWLWTEQKSQTDFNSNSNNNNNSNSNNNSNINTDSNISNFNFYINPINNNSSSLLDQTKSVETKNSQNIPQIVTITDDDIEFNRTDGTIVIFRKPSPSFLKYGRSSSNNSSLLSLHENNSFISEYSLGSSFSRTYGSIIIPRKYNERDTSIHNSVQRDSITIGGNQTISTYSENSINSKRLSSSLSDKTSRSSNYDGSIIIKLVR